MAEGCIFNQATSDLLQHIAVFLEVLAIVLVWCDYKIRESDLSKKGRGTMLAGLPIPHDKRIKGLLFALGLGVIAVCMEIYQLASQYVGC